MNSNWTLGRLCSYIINLSISEKPSNIANTFIRSTQTWSILKALTKNSFQEVDKKHACLLLNISDTCDKDFQRYKFVWDESSLKVAVNGSANHLAKRKLLHTADIVCGDFDSVDKSLVQRLKYGATSSNNPSSSETSNEDYRYQTLPRVIETPSQKETDFTKAVRIVMTTRPEIKYIYALYYSDGTRIDHLFGLVNTLHLFKRRLILINIHSDTISWLLYPGSHVIEKSRGSDLCSVIPFNGQAVVKTKGLIYDIQPNLPLSFTGIISTSNVSRSDCQSISLDTNKELLFSIDLNSQINH